MPNTSSKQDAPLDDFDLFMEEDSGLSAAVLTQRSLIDTQERLGSMLDVMPIGLLIHTEQGILFANKEVCNLLQVENKRLVGQHFLDYVPESDFEPVSAQLRDSFAGAEDAREHECLINRADGTQRLVRLVTGRLPWEGNPVIQVLLHDVTDQKRAENSLRQLTITDELTGAYNRRHLMYESALYVDRSLKERVPLSAVLMDIDHFKQINDTHGHAVGDLALKALTRLANAIIPTLRETDSAIFARIGGEEFVVLLPGVAMERSVAFAERLRGAVEAMKVDTPAGKLKFTVSMGVAQFRETDDKFEGTLERADSALYAAKSRGRNCVQVAD